MWGKWNKQSGENFMFEIFIQVGSFVIGFIIGWYFITPLAIKISEWMIKKWNQ